MTKKILVLEDEDNIRGFVVLNLKRAGYEVVEAVSGQQALDMLAADRSIAIAVLDVMLPDIDGFEVCSRIRNSGSRVGIVMLTAMSQENDKIAGLMTGADDYVTKPFSVTELVARIDALHRRLTGLSGEPDVVVSGPFEFNLRSRELRKNGEKIDLTQVEYLIMKTFLENIDTAMSREELLSQVWGTDYLGDLKIVDVNIRRLRLKVEEDPAQPRHIQTLWGYGYKWQQ